MIAKLNSKKSNNLDEIWYKGQYSKEFIQKYNNSRKLFEVFKDKIDLKNIPIHNSSCDFQKLNKYLVEDCAISEKRVDNALKKINVLV